MELWGSLAKGVRVVIPQPEEFQDHERLLVSLAEHRVSRICLVPSLLRDLPGHARSVDSRDAVPPPLGV